ncbi:hypothetical protein N0V85_006184 [Neurospora sp. IMI 360204]|nr:hypothetical protein N0V85_006184 [Neurospora sp. IMI 360204]
MSEAMTRSCSGVVRVLVPTPQSIGNKVYTRIWLFYEYAALRELYALGRVKRLIAIETMKPENQYELEVLAGNFVAESSAGTMVTYPAEPRITRQLDASDPDYLPNLSAGIYNLKIRKRDACLGNLQWEAALGQDWFG